MTTIALTCFTGHFVNSGPNTKDASLHVWPIRTEEDYSRAQQVVDKLAVKGEDALTEDERCQLEVFTTLMEAYERVHYPINPKEVSPIEFLERLLRESGLSASDLGHILGDRALGFRILKGKRQLSKSHIRKLGEYFKVDPGAFL